jgi:hypothetical protein
MGSLVSGLVQVCLVTEDFEGTVANLAHNLRIGPWKCWHYQPPSLLDTRLKGAPTAWTMKLGVAWVGPVQLEVIQPVTGTTIYREFLEKQGQGAQHLLVETGPVYFEAIKAFEKAGYPNLQSGRINPPMQVAGLSLPPLPGPLAGRFATQFAYFGTQPALGTVLEISKMPPGVPFRTGVRLGKPDFWVPAGSRDVEASLPGHLIDGITTVGLVLPDVDAAVQNWASLGVGPWQRQTGGGVTRARAALAPVRLELVQPDGPGAYRDMLDRQGAGIGFLGVQTAAGGAAQLRSLGFPLLEEHERETLLEARALASTASPRS